jgi:hypothetical protein
MPLCTPPIPRDFYSRFYIPPGIITAEPEATTDTTVAKDFFRLPSQVLARLGVSLIV